MTGKAKCKNCTILFHGWCDKIIDSPDPEMERDCEHFQQRTNADWIRSASDEELALFLGRDRISDCPYPEENCGDRKCEECFLKWLKQPMEVQGDVEKV